MRLCALLLLLFGLTGPVISAEFEVESLDQIVKMHGVWRFRAGDNLSWASPDYDHRLWDNILVPKDWRRQGHRDLTGIAWYRARVQLDLDNPAVRESLHELGVSLGRIHSAYEFYAGGILLGGAGKLPPEPLAVSDRIRIFSIPREAVSDDGKLVLAVRVWREEVVGSSSTSGMYEGNFSIGRIFDLTKSVYFTEAASLMLAICYFAFGLYHLYLHARNRRLKEFLWFGIISILIGIYTIETSQWKHVVGFLSNLPYGLHNKVEYAVIYVAPAVGLEFLMSLLRFRPPWWIRLYQAGFVALALTAALIPGTDVLTLTLGFWQIYTVPALITGLVLVVWSAVQGSREARTMTICWGIFLYTSVNDILLANGLVQTPRLLPVGFAAVLICMAMSLANRFTRMYNHLDWLVQERTAALERSNEQLVQAARLDTLTGLLNRRGFFEMAEAELARAKRSGRSFVILLADIDRFKAVNDSFGHACGDFVLLQTAELLQEHLRDVDIVARWGGEEFVFMLPETSLEGGITLAEKLRSVVAESHFVYQEHVISLTLTFGVAAFTEDMSGVDDCIGAADDAMYSGKEGGRNRVLVAAEPRGESSGGHGNPVRNRRAGSLN